MQTGVKLVLFMPVYALVLMFMYLMVLCFEREPIWRYIRGGGVIVKVREHLHG